jgi:periplasmic protein CpxP/Spy
MKKLIVLTALAIAVAIGGASAWAQTGEGMAGSMGGHGQPMSADQRLQMMTKQLNLTADQQEKIKPMLESQNQQMQALHQDTSLSQEDRMSKMRQIRQNTNDQIKSVLDADQQQKFQEMNSRHGRGPGGPPPGQSAPPPQ